MELDDFIALFHGGWNNPMQLAHIASLSHMGQRKVRKMIEEVNTSGKAMICNLQDGRGYFIPLDNEMHYARLFQKQEAKRFNSLKDKLQGINTFLEGNRKHRVSELEKGQVSIFDYEGII